MSTVQHTMTMQDAMSKPLMNITKSLNMVISTMQQMHSTSEKSADMGKSLVTAKKAVAEAESGIKQAVEKAAESQRKFNKEVQKGSGLVNSLEGGFKSLATSVAGTVAAFLGINAIKNKLSDLFSTGVNFHAFKQQSAEAFSTFLGDAAKAKQYMDDMLTFARTTPFGYPELLESSRNLIAFGIQAEATFPIMQAIGDTVAAIGGGNKELMGMADVFGAIQVSGQLSLQEVNRLGLYGVNALQMLADKAGVTATEMKKKISAGSVGAGYAITTLVEGMENQFGGLMSGVKGTWAGTIDSFKSAWRNAGAALMESYMAPLTSLIQNVSGLFKRLPELIGPAVSAFQPFLSMLNEAFETGRFEPFFIAMGAGLTAVSWMISSTGMAAIWLAEIVAEYWPIITAFLAVWAYTYLPAVAMAAYTAAIALFNIARAWLVALGPIGWTLIGLIALLKIFGITTEQIIGFVGGLFFSLFSGIWNILAETWNRIAMLAEFIWNVFVDPTYAVKKLFYDMVMNAVDLMSALAGSFDKAADVLAKVFVSAANIAIGGINGLIKALNMIPGVDIGEISKIDPGKIETLSSAMKNLANNIQAPTSDKNVIDIPKMSYASMPGAFKAGSEFGSMIGSGISNALKMPSMAGLDPANIDHLMNMPDLMGADGAGKGKKPNIGKVDKVGKIEDTVDISSEDLKVMRELAEMKSIQNFVTLTPTVQVTTGDIRKDADFSTLIREIEDHMIDEISRSAEGVYS